MRRTSSVCGVTQRFFWAKAPRLAMALSGLASSVGAACGISFHATGEPVQRDMAVRLSYKPVADPDGGCGHKTVGSHSGKRLLTRSINMALATAASM